MKILIEHMRENVYILRSTFVC